MPPSLVLHLNPVGSSPRPFACAAGVSMRLCHVRVNCEKWPLRRLENFLGTGRVNDESLQSIHHTNVQKIKKKILTSLSPVPCHTRSCLPSLCLPKSGHNLVFHKFSLKPAMAQYGGTCSSVEKKQYETLNKQQLGDWNFVSTHTWPGGIGLHSPPVDQEREKETRTWDMVVAVFLFGIYQNSTRMHARYV